jgi:hypothetical protein
MQPAKLYLFTCLLLLLSCRQEEVKIDNNNKKRNTLPEATQTGAHTLGFYLNNGLWLPSEDCSSNCAELTSYYSVLGFIDGEKVPYYNIYATGGKDANQHFEMQVMRLTSVGPYFLHNDIFGNLEDLPSYAVLVETSPTGDKRIYVSDTTRTPFVVTITTIDFLNNTTPIPIVSGTFEGVLYNRENSKDSLFVKQGRFDLKY